MTGFGALLGQWSTRAIVGGLAIGIAGGSLLIATGHAPVGETPPTSANVALLACPGSGAVLASVPVGTSLLVTARSVDGQWLEAYLGEPGVDYAWAPAADVHLASPADALPVGDCIAGTTAQQSASPTAVIVAVATASPAATVSPSGLVIPAEPTPTLQPIVIPLATPFATSTPTSSPTSTATLTATPTATLTPIPTATLTAPPTATLTAPPTAPPTPTPTPTIEPGPSLSGLTPSTYALDSYSACGPTTVHWTVTASDPDGASAVSSVILYYTIGGAGSSLQMSTTDGGTTWSTTNLGYSTSWPTGAMTYYATATDQNGLTFQTSQNSIKVVDCTSPSLSNLTDQAVGDDIGCFGSATITVSASDPDDGVQQVLLTWYGPAYTSQPPAGQVSMTYSLFYHAWQGTLSDPGWGATAFAVLYNATATDYHGKSSAPLWSSTTTPSDPSYLLYSCLY
jgi:hypothetical protein